MPFKDIFSKSIKRNSTITICDFENEGRPLAVFLFGHNKKCASGHVQRYFNQLMQYGFLFRSNANEESNESFDR